MSKFLWDEGDLKVVAVKYSEDQPRVPAGSPEGGQWVAVESGWTWTGQGKPDRYPNDPTSEVGGMALAEQHKDTIFKMAGNTDAFDKEHGVMIGPGGKASRIVQGSHMSVSMPRPERGAYGSIHTHPTRGITEPSGPSPEDIQAHMAAAWESDNQNFTSIVASLSTGSSAVKIFTVKGWPKGGPRKVSEKIYDFVFSHVPNRLLSPSGISDDEWMRMANDAIKTYATTILGLEWEEAWFD